MRRQAISGRILRLNAAPALLSFLELPMNFDEVNDALFDAGLAASPAELHGLLCGVICGGRRLTSDQLCQLAELQLDAEPAEIEPVRETLAALYDHAVGQIRNGGFVFKPLLPSDETDIDERIVALGLWCQGYLFGLGQSELDRDASLAAEIAEVLRDMAAISQVGIDDGADDDEQSYMELVEYVRVAVLLVAAELDTSSDSDTTTLH